MHDYHENNDLMKREKIKWKKSRCKCCEGNPRNGFPRSICLSWCTIWLSCFSFEWVEVKYNARAFVQSKMGPIIPWFSLLAWFGLICLYKYGDRERLCHFLRFVTRPKKIYSVFDINHRKSATHTHTHTQMCLIHINLIPWRQPNLKLVQISRITHIIPMAVILYGNISYLNVPNGPDSKISSSCNIFHFLHFLIRFSFICHSMKCQTVSQNWNTCFSSKMEMITRAKFMYFLKIHGRDVEHFS